MTLNDLELRDSGFLVNFFHDFRWWRSRTLPVSWSLSRISTSASAPDEARTRDKRHPHFTVFCGNSTAFDWVTDGLGRQTGQGYSKSKQKQFSVSEGLEDAPKYSSHDPEKKFIQGSALVDFYTQTRLLTAPPFLRLGCLTSASKSKCTSLFIA